MRGRWTEGYCSGSYQVIDESTREKGFIGRKGRKEHVYRDYGQCPICGVRVSIVKGNQINRHIQVPVFGQVKAPKKTDICGE